MARILIGWELGAGRGHLVSLLGMAAALGEYGHKVTLAIQRSEALPPTIPDEFPIVQAPLWPGLLNNYAAGPWRPVSTMIDILARLGMDRPRALKHMLTGWDGLIASVRPDLVIGDYAPALLLAAQGRLPSIATGPGFQVPPADIDPIPRLAGPPGYDEAAMLDIVDADLRETGRPPLEGLGAFFRCSRALIASFHELDPFRRPSGPHFTAPELGSWCPPADTRGEEVFVYLNGPMQRMKPLWEGLSRTGYKVRVHLPVMDDALKALIEGFGIIVERQPIPWPLIAQRSRISVNHGAHGTMSALLCAGIPQLCLPIDLEKRLHSEAMAKQGLGRWLDPDRTNPAQLSRAVRELYEDDALASRGRAAAPGFAARMCVPFRQRVIEAVEALLAA